MGLGSTAALLRTLRDNPFVAQACGIESPDAIPHEATFSRFFTRLSEYHTAARLKDVSRSLVRRCYAELPGFGERVAMDSTTLKGWVNGGKSKSSDKQARWSVKKNTHGKTEFVLGYKLHLLVDSEYELPVAANVSPGNVHDSQRASNLLRESRFTARRNPKFVMADKAYSGKPLFNLIRQQYCAKPIIQANPGHKKLLRELGETQDTPEWKALFSQRTAIERVFSRLKGQRSLNRITVRGLRKVTVHCYLALIAMQASVALTLATHTQPAKVAL
jgi:transposase